MGLPEDIARLEQLLHELVVKYEQYFAGIEKREPLLLLTEVEQLARRYHNVAITNTMLRYKYNSLISTLGVHRQKWNRVNRLIEEGKYERDRFKMALRSCGRAPSSASDNPPPETAPQAQLAKSQLDRLYQEYLEARKECNLPTDSVTREKVASAVERQVPALVEKYGSADVELRVVVENGKPRIKVRAKK